MTRVEEIKSKKSVSLFIMLIRWTNEATRRYLKVRQCRVFGTQATEGCNFEESSPAQPKERRSWSPTEDVVLISSWLNTSKDPVVGNEQRSVAFWKRIATYFNASPKLVGCEKRESSQCKQRWHKINDMWKNCPTAWKGQYTRGSGKPTIVLEAVASEDLWIWHAFFGPPGTLNDINVLDRSPVFDDIIKGHAPAVTYYVNGREYHLAYYLTDGIYPKWATFIQSIPLPQGPKAVLFAQHQEAVRKDVERAFGVLQSRFVIAKNPSLFWDKIKIGRIMRACIILHNMIVEDERDGYSLFNVSEFQQGEDNGSSHVDLMYSTDIPTNIANMMNVRTRIRDRQMHQQLKDDLVEHVWLKFGREDDNN
uniref:Myb-like domain-containing protein n=1 Tax=Brassica oleracea var. oleracea TaxID=109376 RepID=A0A0D3AC53_BRAOL